MGPYELNRVICDLCREDVEGDTLDLAITHQTYEADGEPRKTYEPGTTDNIGCDYYVIGVDCCGKHVSKVWNRLLELMNEQGDIIMEQRSCPKCGHVIQRIDIVDIGQVLKHVTSTDGLRYIVSPDWARGWADLEPRERVILTNLKDIETLELMGKWDDDHVACWGLRINGIGLGFWWYDDYIGREQDMQSKEEVLEYLEDMRTSDYEGQPFYQGDT